VLPHLRAARLPLHSRMENKSPAVFAPATAGCRGKNDSLRHLPAMELLGY